MLSISLFHQNKHHLTYICRLNNPCEKSKTKLLKIKVRMQKIYQLIMFLKSLSHSFCLLLLFGRRRQKSWRRCPYSVYKLEITFGRYVSALLILIVIKFLTYFRAWLDVFVRHQRRNNFSTVICSKHHSI